MGLRFVKVAPRGRHGRRLVEVMQHGNVNPWRRMPVWVVITLFWALQTIAIAVGVLACAARVIAVDVLVRSKQATIARALRAVQVVLWILMHAEAAICLCVGMPSVFCGRDGVSGGVSSVGGQAITRRADPAVVRAQWRCVLQVRIKRVFASILKNDCSTTRHEFGQTKRGRAHTTMTGRVL